MIRKTVIPTLALIVTFALAGPGHLHAQGGHGQGFGLQADIGASVLTGDDFDGWDTGLNFTALGSYAWTTGWELGVAAGFASHDVGAADVQLNQVASVFRKRFYVPTGEAPHVHPYVEGRIGWVQADFDGAGSESGLEAAGGAGVEYWMTQQVSLTGGVNLGYLDVGEASGLHFVPRAGLKVRFGGS